ncbi:hypothetical protein [Caulobacter sp.]|uniref:hypothetical protein n=1 Tax=Caulobacter sp. TaxID=78 RepID=UPI0031D55838
MRTLLIDADILAYQAAASNERRYAWDDGEVSVVADEDKAREFARETLDNLMTALQADDFLICLSDDFHNFRKEVSPTYKGNRTGERPVHLYDIKDWLRDNYPHRLIPRLEADDVMGILATEPGCTDERIIVSADKDMITIPGLLYRPHEKNPKVRFVSVEEADRYHLYQTLIGDSTDFYPGCPGVGPVLAEEMLDGKLRFVRREREITRGKNKGTIKVEWDVEPSPSPWATVVSCYEKKGLTEADALIQARLAKILRHEDFDGRVKLWKPGAN